MIAVPPAKWMRKPVVVEESATLFDKRLANAFNRLA